MTQDDYDIWMRSPLFRVPYSRMCTLCGKPLIAGEWFRSGPIHDAHEGCIEKAKDEMENQK